MASLVTTLTETLRYRGAIGQWSWVLHRLTGLGVVFFLILHVIDTSWAVLAPDLYVRAIAAYQSPLFTLGEFGLVFAVVYHAYNGLRIIIFDARPQWWRHQAKAAQAVLAATVATLIPVFFLMFGHVLSHYGSQPLILPITSVLLEQLPFLIGIGVAAVLAAVLSGLYGMVTGNKDAAPVDRATGSRTERFWWSFMRISGLLIVPLVFGHLAIMHVVQGVFDIQGSHVVEESLTSVGTSWETMGFNVSGTAVEFVGDRWNTQIAGVYVWRIYDVALLALVVAHGFNGLRYVLTDYTMQNAFARRTAVYFTIIGGTILLLAGGAMLIRSVDSTAIKMATRSLCELYAEYHPEGVPESLTGSARGLSAAAEDPNAPVVAEMLAACAASGGE